MEKDSRSQKLKDILSKSFQYPKAKRLIVLKYVYNNRSRDDLYIYGIYLDLKSLVGMKRPKPVADFIKWGIKYSLLNKTRNKTINGRNRQYYQLNKVGVEFCENYFDLLGIDFRSSGE